MSTKMKIIRLPVIALLLGVCVWKACDDMSVEEIKREYRTHTSLFEEVIAMLKADQHVSRVSKTQPEAPERLGLDAHRVAKYRALLAELDSPAIQVFRDPLEVFFTLDRWGLAVSGWQSGVAYIESQNVRGLLSTNLQAEMNKPTKTTFQYEHIEGNWYVYFLYED